MVKLISSSATAMAVALGLSANASPSAQTDLTKYGEKILYSVKGSADGAILDSPLTADEDGNLFGPTLGGGIAGDGTIFKFTPDGEYTVLHSFEGGADGEDPQGGLTYDAANGDLYGTTDFGGDGGDCFGHGCGTIFKIAANGTETILHAFTGADGYAPESRMARDKQGNLFGSTIYGGTHGEFGSGVIFKLGTDGSYKILHDFTGGADGFGPSGSLILQRDGTLIGVAGEGGNTNCFNGEGCGTIYSLSVKGKLKVLHAFDGMNGNAPVGGLASDKNGNLYGTTLYGGANNFGVLFKLSPKGKYTVLHTFAGGADGSHPTGDLLTAADGEIYGTTDGEEAQDAGTVFVVKADGSFKTAYAFAGKPDGQDPYAGLIEKRGRLYGVTSQGGKNDLGTLFSITIK